MALGHVLRESIALERALDAVVDGAGHEPGRQARADWVWYRFATVNVLVRQQGAGPVAATLARGLLEQAAYWDFGLANGNGEATINAWAASEYQGLRQLAQEIDDETWLGWVLPPGEVLRSRGSVIPRNRADAVQRIGDGFAEAVLEPLRYGGLLEANRILDVLTHGNLAAALVMAPGGGDMLPEPLAAAVLHVAAVSAVANVTAELRTPDNTTAGLVALASSVASAASQMHGLRPQTRIARAPAKPVTVPPLYVRSEIERLPSAPDAVTAVADDFIGFARRLVAVASNRPILGDGGAQAALAAFQMSWGHLRVVLGATRGTLGRALVPITARALLEDGARWEWLRINASNAPTGDSMRAIVANSRRHISRVRETMISAGSHPQEVDALLAAAGSLRETDPGDSNLPPIDLLLAVAYPNASGIDSARVMYSVLSQFVHATPISVLHLRRDTFHSITAPIHAIGIEAACRGFFAIARTTLTISADRSQLLEEATQDLAEALGRVRLAAAPWHCLG